MPVELSPSLLLIWIALATLCIGTTYEEERQGPAAEAATGEGQPLIISLKNLQQAPHLLAPQNDAPPAPSAASTGARGSAGGAGGGRVISLKNLGQSQQQPPRDSPDASSPSPKRAFASGQNPASPRTISLAGLGDAENASPNQNPGSGQQQAIPAPAPQPPPPQEQPLPVPRVVVPRMPPSAIGFGQGNTQRLAWAGPGSGSRSGSGSVFGSGQGSGSGSGPGAETGGEERALSPGEQRLVTYMRKVYTALMEKEGPGAREDNAVFAITAEPGALLSILPLLADRCKSVSCPKGQLGNF